MDNQHPTQLPTLPQQNKYDEYLTLSATHPQYPIPAGYRAQIHAAAGMDLETGDDLIALKESIQDSGIQSSDIESIENADEYARSNGLTIDSLDDKLVNIWSSQLGHDALLTSTLAPPEPDQYLESKGLQECSFRTIIPLPELWDMPRSILPLLEEARRRHTEDEVADLKKQLSRPACRESSALKFDEPILLSDHDADCQALRKRLDVFRRGPLPNHRLPFHPVDPEEDEGLEFTTRAKMGDRLLMEMAAKQKLDAKKEVLIAIFSPCIKSDWTDEDRDELIESLSTYHGLGDQGYVTPPLSPVLESNPESIEYFVPTVESCHVPEPSIPSSELSTDIKMVERKIFQEENNFWASAASKPLASPESYDDLNISGMIKAGELPCQNQSSIPAPQLESLKLDVPLLPDDMALDTAEEPIRVITPQDIAQARELISTSDDSDTADVEFSRFIQSKSNKVLRSAEQEKLNPLDGTARVPIPVMDFSVPRCEWENEGIGTPAKMLDWIMKDNNNTNWKPTKWPSNKIAEQRMVWSPLPHPRDTKRLVSEQIEVEPDVLECFLKRSMDDDVIGSIDCIEKNPGLAIFQLDDQNDDNDLIDEVDEDMGHCQQTGNSGHKPATSGVSDGPLSAPAMHPGDARYAEDDEDGDGLRDRIDEDMNYSRKIGNSGYKPTIRQVLDGPLPGRKRAREETNDEHNQRRTSPIEGFDTNKRPALAKSRDSHAADMAMFDYSAELDLLMNVDQWDDHSKLAERYAKSHSSKLAKITNRFFGQSQRVAQSPRLEEQAAEMPPPPKPIPALAPSFTPPATLPDIVIASSVSQLLTINLQNLLPGIVIIQRDYDKRRPRGWYPGLRSPNLDEADIALSPATGILFTTMVRLRQKPLSGKAGQGNNFRHVVENVTTRYERLIVFISEGNKHDETITPLPKSDAKALVDFQGFAAGLSTDVSVIYVGGGTETLSKWVAATICQYVFEGLLVQDPLLDEETYWELFLWRAGMNVYGAQAVLGSLKTLGDEPAIGRDEPPYGLPQFIDMTVEERIVVFEDLFRGRKVLNRVSEAIDEPWGQREVDEIRYLQGVTFPLVNLDGAMRYEFRS